MSTFVGHTLGGLFVASLVEDTKCRFSFLKVLFISVLVILPDLDVLLVTIQHILLYQIIA